MKTPSIETQIAVISSKLTNVESIATDIKNKLETNYVTKERFDSFITGRYRFVETIVYGVITIIASVVLYSLLGLLGLRK